MKLPFLKKSKGKNINLLTEEEATTVSVKRNVFIILSIPILVLIFLLIVFAVLFLFEQREAGKSAEIAGKINETEAQWQKFSETATSVKNIKSALDTRQNQEIQNEKTLDAATSIRSVIPNTVTLQKMDIKEDGDATIDGTAANPKTIFQLLTLLNSKSDKFTDVSLLSIGFSAGDNQKKQNLYNFSLSFKIISE
ncbi:PilN domain-containing protein [Patescibacteria group bacterium]|nr:PilN domain-containing protein [Patescibacteria group bacterium]